MGPTAVGKTSLAVKLANKFRGEIISADSRQVYRGMDIGTGKDIEEYKINDCSIPYHLIDICDPAGEFDLFNFVRLFNDAFAKIVERGGLPILTGGTGMYIHSVLKGYELKEADFDRRYDRLSKQPIEKLREKLVKINPALHNVTDLNDKERIIRALILADEKNPKILKPVQTNPFVIGIILPRGEIKKRITLRLKSRLENGMIEEAEQLIDSGVTHEKLIFFGLEYKYLSLYLQGMMNYNDMFQKLNSAIHKFAKKQMTWFRKMEREGIEIHWIDGPDFDAADKLLTKYLSGK